MKVIVSASDFSATIAIALLFCPISCSPMINSVVVVEELFNEIRSIDGAEPVPETVDES